MFTCGELGAVGLSGVTLSVGADVPMGTVGGYVMFWNWNVGAMVGLPGRTGANVGAKTGAGVVADGGIAGAAVTGGPPLGGSVFVLQMTPMSSMCVQSLPVTRAEHSKIEASVPSHCTSSRAIGCRTDPIPNDVAARFVCVVPEANPSCDDVGGNMSGRVSRGIAARAGKEENDDGNLRRDILAENVRDMVHK